MMSNLSLSRNSSEAEQVSLAFLYRPVQFNSIRENEILFFCVKKSSCLYQVQNMDWFLPFHIAILPKSLTVAFVAKTP
jgi:hypothetical protein